MKNISQTYKKLSQNNYVRWGIVVFPALFLVAVIYWVGKHAILAASTDSDGLVNTYLFTNYNLHDMLIPGNHTLLLKWPLFALQALFPYGYQSYAFFDFFLLFTTIIGWCVGLTVIYGKKYFPAICLLLSGLLLGSTQLPYWLIYGSLRNIEYPIGLFFLIIIGFILTQEKLTKAKKILTICISILFGLAVGSDSLMAISFGLPVLALITVYWLKGNSLKRRILIACAVTIGTIVGGLAVIKIAGWIGLALYHYDDAFKPKIVSFDLLWPSIIYSFEQLFGLMGASIAGKYLTLRDSLTFFKFFISLIGIAGLVFVLRRMIKDTFTSFLKDRQLLLENLLSLSFVFTIGAYIIFGLVLSAYPHGEGVNNGANTRYIALLPFLIIVGVIVVYKNLHHRKQLLAIAAFVVFVLCVIASFHTIRTEIKSMDDVSSANVSHFQNVANALKENGVQFIASGYWSGAATRFWSGNSIDYLSTDCDHPAPHFNLRISWTTDKTYSKTALLIDRTRDKDYWTCTDTMIQQTYGKPLKKISLSDSGGNVEIWIYNGDVRSHLTKDILN